MLKYLICYDISDNSCRRKVVKYLESMARRLQYSVFVVDCSSSKIEVARKKWVAQYEHYITQERKMLNGLSWRKFIFKKIEEFADMVWKMQA